MKEEEHHPVEALQQLVVTAVLGPLREMEKIKVMGELTFQLLFYKLLSLCCRAEGGGTNPGNNLHVSGLSSKIDSRELESIFAKIGKVRIVIILVVFY